MGSALKILKWTLDNFAAAGWIVEVLMQLYTQIGIYYFWHIYMTYLYIYVIYDIWKYVNMGVKSCIRTSTIQATATKLSNVHFNILNVGSHLGQGIQRPSIFRAYADLLGGEK